VFGFHFLRVKYTVSEAILRLDGRSTYLMLPSPLVALLLDTLHLTFEMFRLDIYLSESDMQMSHSKEDKETETHFSTVSFKFFSAASSSSSRSSILRVRESLVALPLSASNKADFVSANFVSDSWREASVTLSL
jgi:hypothetical protein